MYHYNVICDSHHKNEFVSLLIISLDFYVIFLSCYTLRDTGIFLKKNIQIIRLIDPGIKKQKQKMNKIIYKIYVQKMLLINIFTCSKYHMIHCLSFSFVHYGKRYANIFFHMLYIYVKAKYIKLIIYKNTTKNVSSILSQ